MDDRQTIALLLEILKKYPFSDEEREAVKNAIGLLGWTKLVEVKLENRRRKREKGD